MFAGPTRCIWRTEISCQHASPTSSQNQEVEHTQNLGFWFVLGNRKLWCCWASIPGCFKWPEALQMWLSCHFDKALYLLGLLPSCSLPELLLLQLFTSVTSELYSTEDKAFVFVFLEPSTVLWCIRCENVSSWKFQSKEAYVRSDRSEKWG